MVDPRLVGGLVAKLCLTLAWTAAYQAPLSTGFSRHPGVGDGQGGLACCDSWGRKESDTTE